MKIKHHLLMLSLPLLSMLSFVACSDNFTPEVVTPTRFTYNERIFNNANSLTYCLDSLGAPIVSIAGAPDWMETSYSLDSQEVPLLTVSYQDLQGSAEREAQLLVTAQNGNTALVTFVQLPYIETNTTLTDTVKWFNDWESVKTVQVYIKQGINDPIEVYTPWYRNDEVNFDKELLKNLTRKDGWEMAFSRLSDNRLPNVRYFGLYNRYLGQLRLFCYVCNTDIFGANTGEISFELLYGGSDKISLYPFYNSLAYSIPTNHNPQSEEHKLDLKKNLINAKLSHSFHDYKAPSVEFDSRKMHQGWTCIELNLSGYMPDTLHWDLQNPSEHRLNLHCMSQQEQKLTLSGELLGDLKGDFKSSQVVQRGESSPLTGWAGLMSRFAEIGSCASMFAYAFQFFSYSRSAGMSTAPDILNIISSAVTTSSTVLNQFVPIEPDLQNFEGKADFSLKASINLNGYLNSTTNNGVGSLALTQRDLNVADSLKTSDNNSRQFGRGILSLDQDPVVCVATEDIMANTWGFNLLLDGAKGHTYTNPDFDKYQARLITFLDPTSIHLNLNTDAYDGQPVTDVKIYATTYVNPEVKYQETNAYREMLGLDRPTVDLSCNRTDGILSFSEFSHELPIRLHRVRCTDLVSELKSEVPELCPSESPANCEVVQQNGSQIRYYGRVCELNGRKYIYEPQIFIPYYKKEKKEQEDTTRIVSDGMLPDLVVAVSVSFKVNGKPYFFTQHYLPKFDMLNHEALLKRRREIREFTEKCINGTTDFKLHNDETVPVTFPYGYAMTHKTLKMLDYIDK